MGLFLCQQAGDAGAVAWIQTNFGESWNRWERVERINIQVTQVTTKDFIEMR